MLKKILLYLSVLGNVYFIGYISLLTFLFSLDFIDSGIASQLTTVGWARIAITRFLGLSLVGVVLSCITFLINKYIFRFFIGVPNKLHMYFSLALLFNSVLVALLGSIYIFIDKPWF